MAGNCTLFVDKQHYCVSFPRNFTDIQCECFSGDFALTQTIFTFQTAIYAVKQTMSSLELIGRYVNLL